ncbi:MAG: hypothetical protein RR696_15050, partial [Clostridia bacterium]
MMNDPFEPTPMGFHNRMEQTLTKLQHEKATTRSYRWVAVLAACLVLLGGTALALNHFGVVYFLTERVWMGNPVDETAVVRSFDQSCDSAVLDASLQDAYWDGKTLSLTMNIAPKGDYAFYIETDRGQDGENFDLIWWKGEILPFEEWKNGREGLMLSLPELKINGERANQSWDWVQDEQGEMMLLTGRAADLTNGADISITLPCTLEASNTTETATLTAHLLPMKKG